MKKLGNTLYITLPDVYLALDGETIVVRQKETDCKRIPLHNLEEILVFSYTGVSPALMGACARRGIALCFLTPNGRFLARVTGGQQGNVILRKTQYRVSEDERGSAGIAKSMLIGKIYNARQVVQRALRDYPLRVDGGKLSRVSGFLQQSLSRLDSVQTLQELRGVEGEAAAQYFSIFDDLILQQKEHFPFTVRSRRPPLDNVNALLSFSYTLLCNDTASALEGVGLDPYVGFLHQDRPGRLSLALDLMEELRAAVADRFVLSLINRKMVCEKGFVQKEDGAVLMDDETRRAVLTAWQNRKRETLKHPFLEEKVEWGLVPHIQALLLARYLRGDLDAYPPFFWR